MSLSQPISIESIRAHNTVPRIDDSEFRRIGAKLKKSKKKKKEGTKAGDFSPFKE